MKRIVLSAFLFISGFIINSCETIDTVDPNDPYLIKKFSVSGIIWDHVNNNSPNRAANVQVVIGSDTSLSNSDGEFMFKDIPEGMNYLNVLLPAYYEPCFDTINILSDTTIDLHIFGVREDYFPIEVNTQKYYRYHSSSAGGLFWVSDSGEVVWNIFSVVQQEDKFIYNVEETLIYVRTTQNGGIYPPDTIVTEFKFIEDMSNNTITVESSIWNGVVFNRYLDPRGGEIIQFPDYISIYTVFLKRNVGLIRLRYQNNLYLSSTTYELIE